MYKKKISISRYLQQRVVKHLWFVCIHIQDSQCTQVRILSSLWIAKPLSLLWSFSVGCKTLFSLLIHQYTSLIHPLHLSTRKSVLLPLKVLTVTTCTIYLLEYFTQYCELAKHYPISWRAKTNTQTKQPPPPTVLVRNMKKKLFSTRNSLDI